METNSTIFTDDGMVQVDDILYTDGNLFEVTEITDSTSMKIRHIGLLESMWMVTKAITLKLWIKICNLKSQ